jgi:acetate kinase
LLQHAGIRPEELADTLEYRSGLHALAGTADMRRILAAADEGDAAARLALEVYIHRLVSGVASMAAAVGGMDALVFTGGVGEHAHAIRELAAERLAFLGVRVDPDANEMPGGDREISAADARVRSFVVTAREELEIAGEVRSVLGGGSRG